MAYWRGLEDRAFFDRVKMLKICYNKDELFIIYTYKLMSLKAFWSRFSKNETLAIVTLATGLASGLFTVEHVSGLPASVRGNPVYDALELPLLLTVTKSGSTARAIPARESLRKAAARREAAKMRRYELLRRAAARRLGAKTSSEPSR